MAVTDSAPDEDTLPPGPFVKIYGSILDSSIWRESANTRILWIAMLAIADPNGYVRASVGGLAYRANMTTAECKAALEILQAPDEDDRSGVEDGRRIKPLQGGWHIINFRDYREMRTPRQIASAERVRRHREKKRTSDANGVTSVTVTPEGEGEGEVEGERQAEVDDAEARTNPLVHIRPVENSDAPAPAATADPIRAGMSDRERALELTIAINQGLADNPLVGEHPQPVLANSGTTLDAAKAIADMGIHHAWAIRAAYTVGRRFQPERAGQTIGSLAYLPPRLEKPWAQRAAKDAAAAAERPQELETDDASPATAVPSTNGGNGRQASGNRRDLKGEGLLLFGRLRDGVREETVLNDPSMGIAGGNRREPRIRAELLEVLDAAGRDALAAIGGERAITHPRDETIGWKFAAAYAAAAANG